MVRFVENLTLSSDGIASQAGEPFVLRPWQRAIVRELFGRMREDDATRRVYRTAFIALPRKNGKTELCAALALYGLVGDGVKGAQVYSAAAEREQAALVFNAARAMVEAEPELSERIDVQVTRKRMIDRASNSFYQALSAEAYSKHGFNASMVIYDELHAAPNRELWDVLRTSQGARREPQMIAITTAGFDKLSICWELWDYARKVRDGVIMDPAFYQCLYEAPDDADWTDERAWWAANPALGDFRDIEEMRALALESRHKPEQQNTFRRLYLNQWTEQDTRWLDMHRWQECRRVSEHEAQQLPSFAGLDLGRKSDMSAFVAVTPLQDGRVLVRARIWMPDQSRETFHGRPYATWEQAGALVITEGNVSDFGRIAREVQALCETWHVVEVAYDERHAEPLVQQMQMPHVLVHPEPQGYGLNVGLRALEDHVVGGTLGHNGHPVLTWMASNAVVETGNQGDIAVNKRKNREKIDGIVALAMALQRASLNQVAPESPYESEDYEMEAAEW